MSLKFYLIHDRAHPASSLHQPMIFENWCLRSLNSCNHSWHPLLLYSLPSCILRRFLQTEICFIAQHCKLQCFSVVYEGVGSAAWFRYRRLLNATDYQAMLMIFIIDSLLYAKWYFKRSKRAATCTYKVHGCKAIKKFSVDMWQNLLFQI